MWKQIITDPNEIKVFMALDGPTLTWRTFGGIARQTGLTEEYVAQIAAQYSPSLIRLSETPSLSGNALIGLVENVGPGMPFDE
jgi:hypothetical protein